MVSNKTRLNMLGTYQDIVIVSGIVHKGCKNVFLIGSNKIVVILVCFNFSDNSNIVAQNVNSKTHDHEQLYITYYAST